MKDIKVTITIKRAAHEVFDFTLNPENTPKWVDSVVTEQASEWPTKLGTIYRNQDEDGNWREFEITAYSPGIMFEMTKKDDNHHVRYTLKPLGDDRCELEYHVWTDDGELRGAFTKETIEKILQKLKKVIEAPKRYVITLKSGEKHLTERFDSDEAALKWVNTGAAGIVYPDRYVPILPDNIADIQWVEDNK